MTTEMVEIERGAFEAALRTADNYDAKYMKRDSAHPDYYANRIIQASWEGWCAKTRAKSQRAVAVAELETLRTEIRAQAGLKDNYQDWDETERMLNALIDRAGGAS
ncbi:hypothetical protein [Luteibacter sp.]|uniref:hypothetical protein n=1 Tax=Luteibacter sp. TaxID=1886636 RepID=UPI0025BD2261|nr:hypothetical protein [Luteibacter sp.]